MKTRKAKPVFNGITFDSNDEIEFYYWCTEAQQAGLLAEFKYQAPSFELSPSVKLETPRFGVRGQALKPASRTLFRPTTYTADFELAFTDVGDAVKCGFRVIDDSTVLVDVKPAFERDHARARKFAVLQKWVFKEFRRYVQPIVPIELFGKTWCPERARLTPTGKPRKSAKYSKLTTLDAWLSSTAIQESNYRERRNDGEESRN